MGLPGPKVREGGERREEGEGEKKGKVHYGFKATCSRGKLGCVNLCVGVLHVFQSMGGIVHWEYRHHCVLWGTCPHNVSCGLQRESHMLGGHHTQMLEGPASPSCITQGQSSAHFFGYGFGEIGKRKKKESRNRIWGSPFLLASFNHKYWWHVEFVIRRFPNSLCPTGKKTMAGHVGVKGVY
jgi:hypothetical protein